MGNMGNKRNTWTNQPANWRAAWRRSRSEAKRESERGKQQADRSHDGAVRLSASPMNPILQTSVGQLAVAAAEELTALRLATALAGPLRGRRKECAHASADRSWLRRCRRTGRGTGSAECSRGVEQRVRVWTATRGARDGVGLVVHRACGGKRNGNSNRKAQARQMRQVVSG